MREKYESLPLAELKAIAKVRGLKGISAMKKADLIELMLAEDEKENTPEAGNGVKADPSGENASDIPNTAAERAPGTENSSRQEAQARAEGQPARNAGYARSDGQASRVEGGGRYDASRGSYGRNDGRNDYRSDNRSDGRNDNRNDNRNDSRNDNGSRSDYRNDNRSDYRNDSRNENRSDNRSDSRSDYRSDNRSDSRSDNRNDGGDFQRQQDGERRTYRPQEVYDENQYPKELDSGIEAMGILEVMPDGYGFIRCENYLPGENDVYVAPSQIRRFGLKTGDILRGNKRIKTQQEKFSALLFIRTINGYSMEEASRRQAFEDMTPIFPDKRIRLETPGCSIAMRVMDLVSPVGKGQRGMIVSPPKAGKTTLLKEVARSILRTNPQMHMLILLIDERPEEVTDIKEAIEGDNVEVIYSTFDELPEHHKRVSEMVIERAKRLVEHKKDVVILLDSITRLTRAYNQVVPPSGRTLSGGLDPSALHMPKRFFGAARNMREGGSLTILATALVETGSKMDDVVYEEFKGTGNMEMVLDRRLSEKRIFPAIDLQKSGTRREDLLLSQEELEAINVMRKALNGMKADEAADRILDMFARTRNNNEFVNMVKKNKFI